MQFGDRTSVHQNPIRHQIPHRRQQNPPLVHLKTFPKEPKAQLAAIRDLLRSSNTPWSIDQIAAQFKNGGRYKNAIAENCDRLEWFSILLCQEENHIKYWQHIETP